MFKDEKKLKECVEWFASKSADFKSKALEDPSSLKKEEQEKFFFIAESIRITLSEHPKEEIIKTLKEMGLKYTACSFVEIILEKFPPIGYSLRIINNLKSEEIRKILEIAIKDRLLGSTRDEEIISALKVKKEIFNNARGVFVSLLNSYLRADTNLEQIKIFLINNGSKEEHAEVFVKLIKKIASEYRDKILFRNVQVMYFEEMKELKEIQRKTNELLKELLRYMKGEKGTYPRDYIG